MYLKPIPLKQTLDDQARISRAKTDLILAEADRFLAKLRDEPILTREEIERRPIEKKLNERLEDIKKRYGDNFPCLEELEGERITFEVKRELEEDRKGK